MKKVFVLAAAALLVTGVTFATKGGKKKQSCCNKGQACCTKGKACCKKTSATAKM